MRRGASVCWARLRGLPWHSQEVQPGIQPVSRWLSLNRPFALSEAMWNHMRPMLAATGAKRMAWPEFSGQDLSDLLVYLRNLPPARFAPFFDISTGVMAGSLFVSKGCETCHGSDTALAGRIRGRTITEIAAAMWATDRGWRPLTRLPLSFNQVKCARC